MARREGRVSEDRLQILLPRQLKRAVEQKAKRLGVSIGAYVRRFIEVDLGNSGRGRPKGISVSARIRFAPVEPKVPSITIGTSRSARGRLSFIALEEANDENHKAAIEFARTLEEGSFGELVFELLRFRRAHGMVLSLSQEEG